MVLTFVSIEFALRALYGRANFSSRSIGSEMLATILTFCETLDLLGLYKRNPVEVEVRITPNVLLKRRTHISSLRVHITLCDIEVSEKSLEVQERVKLLIYCEYFRMA